MWVNRENWALFNNLKLEHTTYITVDAMILVICKKNIYREQKLHIMSRTE